MNLVTCPEKEHLKCQRYGPRNNDAVNMDVIERVAKSRESYYPDNEGIPVIKFYRDNKCVYMWFFDKREEKIRDAVYARLTTKVANA